MATQGGFDYGFVAVKRLVIIMAFLFSRSFRLWLLASSKTSFDRLYCASLFLKIFASTSLGFFFLEICPTIAQDCFWWFLTSRLGVVPSVLFLGLVHLFFFFIFFGFEVLRSVRACLVGVLHYFFKFLSPCLVFHISMGPGRSSILRIGSNSTKASRSGQTGGESDSLAVVVHRDTPGVPPSPLGKGKGKISEIQYPSSSEYLMAAIQNVKAVALVELSLYMGRSWQPGMGSRLESKFGALTC